MSMRHRPSPTPEAILAEFFDAAAAGDRLALCELLDHSRVSASTVRWVPLRISADIVQFWPDWCPQAECNALHIAAAHGHADCVDLLLRHGANKGAKTRHGATALMFAAFHGHVSVVDCLLNSPGEYEINAACTAPSDTDRLGPTALMLAAGSTEGSAASAACVESLLRAGANPHMMCAGSLTALHFAAALRYAQSCACLVRAGCWVKQVDAAGRTPFNYAACSTRGNDDVSDVLQSLCWLPSVRLLWLGHLNEPGAGLGALSRDALRLLCRTIILRHTPPVKPSSIDLPYHDSLVSEMRRYQEDSLFANRFFQVNTT